MRALRRTAVLAATGAVLLAGGCGADGEGPGPAAASPAERYGCLTGDQAAKGSVRIRGSLSDIDAYYRDSDTGGARTAVVLAHQNEGSLCDWMPYLDAFTKSGYAVLPFNSNGDVADGIETAEGWLKKEKGVAKVVLVGASKGGTGSLVAGAVPGPLPVAAVVSLSGPESFGGDNAATAVKRLTVPVFFAAEEFDAPFSDNARSLHATAASAVKQLKIYPGGHHGAPLLSDGAMPDVQAFLATNAPPA